MSRIAHEFRRTFSSVNASRNYRLFFVGQIVSVTGTWFNAAAASVLVLRLTGSGVALGINMALLFLPVLTFGAWGGVLADKHDKRRILIGTQGAAAIVALAMWALVVSGTVRLSMVYALSLAAGVIVALDNPARQSFMVELVGAENLTNAVSLNSAVFTGARAVGMALAGELIHSAGLSTCYLLDGLSYGAVILALVAMTPEGLHEQTRSSRESGHLSEGLRYVWKTPDLRRPLVVMAVVFTFAFNFMVLLPLLAYRTFGGDERTFGWLSAFAGSGMFVAAIAMANRATHPTPRRLAFFAAAFGGSLILESAMPTLPLAFAVMVGAGAAAMLFAITANSTLQLRSRPEMRGRVMALYGIVFLGSTPIGAPIVGWIAQHLGPREGLAFGGLAALVVGLSSLWLRRERHAESVLALSE